MADETAFNWRPTLKRRVLVAAALFVAWTMAIEARLVHLQVVQHEELSARAERQQSRTVTTPAKRGEILDRHGRVLAYSVDADSIYAVPTEVANAPAAAAALCGALDDCTPRERETLVERLSRQRAFVYVRRHVSPLEAGRVAALDLQGVGFMKENRRYYPKKELAAHVLGYVGVDNVGLSGLEASYDKTIRGQAGTLLVQTDARRRGFGREERKPTTGATLELTLDEQLQYIVERELAVAMREYRAEGGSVVVLDPHTGEILALANAPTFNPNAFTQSTGAMRRNRAVQDLYEPGSTFKLVTASAALEEGVIHPGDFIDVSAGSIRFGRRVINDMYRYGVLSFTDVMVKSSNVGAIRVGLNLGPERLGMYVSRFGFGRRSSPDFPGENPGIVWNPARLNDSAVASISMGYQVGVTPLQMATAVSAVANGGNLVVPRIVRAAIRDGVRTPVEPGVVRRVIEPGTAIELTRIMEAIVDRGTATRARVPGYTVAGKTGTAEKLINGRYSKTDHDASFVGFIPSVDPVLAIIVRIDTPRGQGRNTGGVTAAPVFSRIAEASMRHLGVPPNVRAEPPVVVARRSSSPVTTASAAMDTPSIVTVPPAQGVAPTLPDLRGLSARDAARTLARLGLVARLEGSGVVVRQTPAAGMPLEAGGVCTLVLARTPPPLPPSAEGGPQ
ncbi:MAG: penicillin-binding protein [Vicinamibacterales bacterium]|nr:penicillin-binding protein [Vicinamibacterales bacterium]